ncbi:AAA family ATPase [Georgenia sp. M64]|uniref:ATP-binding protein n=1 Tax=Georgenia sp. M64 TaxID=3120520 RepID=UPI0030E549CB
MERDHHLAALDDALRAAATGLGRVALVSGEAGVGKTSLVRAFLARHGRDLRVLSGICDDLSTPRPLGPFVDMAGQAGADLAAALGRGDGADRLYVLLLAEMARPPAPTVMVVEDLHWADAASLDLITYLVRRIHDVPALMILTYRSDEADPGRPLRRVLGQVPPAAAVRVAVEPLSVTAVAHLAEASAVELHRLTGGNPFYVSEVLANPGDVPPSVADAVMARVARLPGPARELVELVAMSPGRLERRVLDACVPGWADAAVVPERRGILEVGPVWVCFRHEIARQAVAAEVPAGHRATLHRLLLDELEAQEADPARLVHHAVALADPDAIVRHGLLAARQAVRYGANTEALAHYRRVSPLADRLPADVRAAVLEEWSVTCLDTAAMAEAAEAARAALTVLRELGDRIGVARVSRFLSGIHYSLGDPRSGDRYLEDAVAVAAGFPRGRDLAQTLATRAIHAMVLWDSEEAVRLGTEAAEMAQSLGEDDVLAQALVAVGAARYGCGHEDGVATVGRGIAIARASGHEHLACVGYANLAETAIEHRHHDLARDSLDRGSALAEEREVLSVLGYLDGLRARLEMDRGRWDVAEALATSVVEGPASTPLNDLNALYTLVRLHSRRGGPDAETLRRLAAAVERSGELQREVLLTVARAERADLAGRLPAQRGALADLYDRVVRCGLPWAIGDVALWLARAGVPVTVPEGVALPIRLELGGDAPAAARAWAGLGCAYDAADALAHGADGTGLVEALRTFDDLGAEAAARRVRELLREQGVRQIPRGPRRGTRTNPAGLTERQVDVLVLLAQGMTNAEIAEQLVVSVRTVDQHVAAILAKLDVPSRRQAAGLAHELGLAGTAAPTG